MNSCRWLLSFETIQTPSCSDNVVDSLTISGFECFHLWVSSISVLVIHNICVGVQRDRWLCVLLLALCLWARAARTNYCFSTVFSCPWLFCFWCLGLLRSSHLSIAVSGRAQTVWLATAGKNQWCCPALSHYCVIWSLSSFFRSHRCFGMAGSFRDRWWRPQFWEVLSVSYRWVPIFLDCCGSVW